MRTDRTITMGVAGLAALLLMGAAHGLAAGVAVAPRVDLASAEPRTEQRSGASEALAGTGWLLLTLAGEPVASGVESTLVFGEDDGAGGNGGCNVYGANAEFEGEDGLSFSEVFSTMMACPEPAMTQERSFFAALEATASYRIDAGSLILLDGEGEAVATLSQQASEAPGV